MPHSLVKPAEDNCFPVRLDCPYEFLSHLETKISEEDVVFRKHVKVAALAVDGYAPDTIAQIVKYRKPHVITILSNYNQRGFYALLDNRRNYDSAYLANLFSRTANRLGVSLRQEHMTAWFTSAPNLLLESTLQQKTVISLGADADSCVETSARNISDNSDSGWIAWVLGIGAFILFGVFTGAMNTPPKIEQTPLNIPNSQSVSPQTLNQP